MTAELFFSGTVLAITSTINNMYVAAKGEDKKLSRRVAGHIEWLFSSILFFYAMPLPEASVWIILFVFIMGVGYIGIVVTSRQFARDYYSNNEPIVTQLT